MSNVAIEKNLQQTNNGTYYCSTTNIKGEVGKMDVAKMIITSNDTTIESLGIPYHSGDAGYYLYMEKDESYAITYSLQGGGADQEGRALISYPKPDGSWTNPKQMGFGGWATNISPDNKYLFYTSIVGVNYATYWIRVDNIIDNLKLTNFVPYLKNPIPDQTDSVGNQFVYTIPDSIFIDDDGNETLTIDAIQGNKKPFPDWITYNPNTLTFYGTPTEPSYLSIKVTATDMAGASVSDLFAIRIEGTTDIFETDLKDRILVFPNPAQNILTIVNNDNTCSEYKIFDINGRLVKRDNLTGESIQLNISELPKGEYLIGLIHDNKLLYTSMFIKK